MANHSKEKEVDERRHLERFDLRGYCEVVSTDDKWSAYIMNISLGGALVAVVDDHNLTKDQVVSLQLEMPDGDLVKVEGRVVHIKDHFLGVEYAPKNALAREHIAALIEFAKQQTEH